ncbi:MULTISPECIES: hypothetical protein [unclassified Amycolatopsis]|uniref:hypothetical protein n=1 Tax=unclassified Amycolatopsis TaxID=2618356 RepID=UPI0028758EA9|nr:MULTISPECIES: hypothetical protein [unclassified Amycolatopsis]MDS0134219.1 hypothetical protein [Amycolatopsis sp. 505]MDS0146840.1 hypothetical protein [Amycolatopsis sp. CM201R]
MTASEVTAMKSAGLRLAAAPARVDVRGSIARSGVPGRPREPVPPRPLTAPGGLGHDRPRAGRDLAELTAPLLAGRP